jgi:hypothetical protein
MLKFNFKQKLTFFTFHRNFMSPLLFVNLMAIVVYNQQVKMTIATN